MIEQEAQWINMLGAFCAKRDIPELTGEALLRQYGISQVDVMVLFGGSILCGGDVLAMAMQNHIARKYVIVGGEGHTTQTLRERVHKEYPDISTQGLPEARVFAAYLKRRYGLTADLLECESTNCGNNITYLLEMLKNNHIDFRSILLAQDATMQRRMEAGLRKYVAQDVLVINYAVYTAQVIARGDSLAYAQDIWGMWEMDRYITLLMGEIPRLRDDAQGYGPAGKGFIAHVDIPEEVQNAFERLREKHSNKIREANPSYASIR